MAFQVFIKFPADGAYTDYTSSCIEKLNFTQNLFDKSSLKYTRSSFQVELKYNSTLLNKLLTAGASDLIDCYIKKDGTTIFTGFVDALRDATLSDKTATYPISILDNSVLLDRPISTEFEIVSGWLYNNATPSLSVLNQLLLSSARAITVSAPTMVGTFGTNYSNSNVWIPYVAVKKDDNLLEVLRQVCFENCYTFFFNNLGVLTLVPLASSISPTFTFSDTNLNIIDGSLRIKKESIAQDSLRVKFREIVALNIGESNTVTINGTTSVPNDYQWDNRLTTETGQTFHCTINLQKSYLKGNVVKIGDYKIHVNTTYLGDPDNDPAPFLIHNEGIEYNSVGGGVTYYPVLQTTKIINPRVAQPTFTNVVRTGSKIDFDFDWGNFGAHEAVLSRIVWSIGCQFFAIIETDTPNPYEIPGAKKDYLELELKYSAQVVQAQNIADWYKNLTITNPYFYQIESYADVALGTVVTLSYSAKGLSTIGVIHSKSYDYDKKIFKYSIKQTSALTLASPIVTSPTLVNTTDLDKIQSAIDLSTGQLTNAIDANKLPDVIGNVFNAGLYFGKDTFGYYDGTNWKTRISSNGNAYFSGQVSAGGDLRSSNYSPGTTGFILKSDGSAELNSLVVNVDLTSSNYVANISGFKLDKATGTASFMQGDIGGWLVTSNSLSSGAVSTNRIVLDKTNNRLTTVDSSNAVKTAQGWLTGLPVSGSPWDASRTYSALGGEYVSRSGIVYKSVAIWGNTNQQPPNATYWTVSTDLYSSTAQGFYSAPGSQLTFAGDTTYNNGAMELANDASLLIKANGLNAIRLGTFGGSKGLFINEANISSSSGFQSLFTASKMYIGDPDRGSIDYDSTRTPALKITGDIASGNFVSGGSGWKLGVDGSAQINSNLVISSVNTKLLHNSTYQELQDSTSLVGRPLPLGGSVYYLESNTLDQYGQTSFRTVQNLAFGAGSKYGLSSVTPVSTTILTRPFSLLTSGTVEGWFNIGAFTTKTTLVSLTGPGGVQVALVVAPAPYSGYGSLTGTYSSGSYGGANMTLPQMYWLIGGNIYPSLPIKSSWMYFSVSRNGVFVGGGGTSSSQSIALGGSTSITEINFNLVAGVQLSHLMITTQISNTITEMDTSFAQGTPYSLLQDKGAIITQSAGGLRVPLLASNPATVTDGALFYDTTNKVLKVGSTGVWTSLVTPNSQQMVQFRAYTASYTSSATTPSYWQASGSPLLNIGGGTWDGVNYTIPVTGTYLIIFRYKYSTASDIAMNLYINSSSGTLGTLADTDYTDSTRTRNFSTVRYLNAGQNISFGNNNGAGVYGATTLDIVKFN